MDTQRPRTVARFEQADCTGHGTLTTFHGGCRCPWCVSKARESACPCPPCATVKAKSPYFELPVDPPTRTRAAVSPQPAAPVRTTRTPTKGTP